MNLDSRLGSIKRLSRHAIYRLVEKRMGEAAKGR